MSRHLKPDAGIADRVRVQVQFEAAAERAGCLAGLRDP